MPPCPINSCRAEWSVEGWIQICSEISVPGYSNLQQALIHTGRVNLTEKCHQPPWNLAALSDRSKAWFEDAQKALFLPSDSNTKFMHQSSGGTGSGLDSIFLNSVQVWSAVISAISSEIWEVLLLILLWLHRNLNPLTTSIRESLVEWQADSEHHVYPVSLLSSDLRSQTSPAARIITWLPLGDFRNFIPSPEKAWTRFMWKFIVL